MLKANELSVGDWIKDSTNCYVRFDGIGCSDYNEINRNNGYPIKVADEDDRYCGIYNPTQKRSYNEHLADVEGIPLNEYMLVCNDFVLNHKDEVLHMNSYHNRNLVVQWMCDSCDLCVIVGGYAIHLKFVHELQRVLRICGMDDVADNFDIGN